MTATFETHRFWTWIEYESVLFAKLCGEAPVRRGRNATMFPDETGRARAAVVKTLLGVRPRE